MVAGFLFKPELVEVTAGTTVTWENTDQILHTATAGTPDAPSGAFDGPLDGAGSSFSHTFEEAGTFAFFCERHPHMRGEVVVR
jgi:plastocyanin